MTWDGGHATIKVNDGRSVVHTDQEILEGLPRNRPTTGRVRSDSDLSPDAVEVVFPLPNPAGARAAQDATLGTSQGIFRFENNSCITYCARILKAGGVSMPGDDAMMTRYLKTLLVRRFEGLG